jgi:hypothetical protein
MVMLRATEPVMARPTLICGVVIVTVGVIPTARFGVAVAADGETGGVGVTGGFTEMFSEKYST